MIEYTRQISKRENIVVTRREENFDKACVSALHLSGGTFDIDDCGHSEQLEEWERSCCIIEIKFESLIMHTGMGGTEFNYRFSAVAMKTIDPDDEE